MLEESGIAVALIGLPSPPAVPGPSHCEVYAAYVSIKFPAEVKSRVLTLRDVWLLANGNMSARTDKHVEP